MSQRRSQFQGLASRRRSLQLERLSARDLLAIDLATWAAANDVAVEPRIVAADSPAAHVATTSSGFNGVAKLNIQRDDGNFLCSGTLLSSGKHVLTAAHCLADSTGQANTDHVQVTLDSSAGQQRMTSTSYTVHPEYDGDVLHGSDLAIIELPRPVSDSINRFDLYRGTNEIDVTGTKVGYGATGTGDVGVTAAGGTKRFGENVYERLGNSVGGSSDILLYDFDNGRSTNDAFGSYFNRIDVGLGSNEVNSAPGDSGGPTFINGQIAGVTSFGMGKLRTDVNNDVDASFGEISGDTRVSSFIDWIETTADLNRPKTSMPNDDVGLTSSSEVFYVSLDRAGTIQDSDGGRLRLDDSDIVRLERATNGDVHATLMFDGSDVGLTTSSADIDAFHMHDDGTIIISFAGTTNLRGVGRVTSSDLVRFTPTKLGSQTAGRWSMYFDGSDVGLTRSGENIDAVTIQPDGTIIVSTSGTTRAGGIRAKDEDLLAFKPRTLGTRTTGEWQPLLRGGDIGLANSNREDIDAVAATADQFHLSTRGKFTTARGSGTSSDLVIVGGISSSKTTAVDEIMRLFEGVGGLNGANLDGVSIGQTAAASTQVTLQQQALFAGPSSFKYVGQAQPTAASITPQNLPALENTSKSAHVASPLIFADSTELQHSKESGAGLRPSSTPPNLEGDVDKALSLELVDDVLAELFARLGRTT